MSEFKFKHFNAYGNNLMLIADEHHHSPDAEVMREGAKEIDRLQQELEAKDNPWISVEDRLPEVGDTVIAGCWNRGTIILAKYLKEGFTVYPESSVTHWMPAPKLPPTQETEQ